MLSMTDSDLSAKIGITQVKSEKVENIYHNSTIKSGLQALFLPVGETISA